MTGEPARAATAPPLGELCARLRLLGARRRPLLGIAGPPGAGKSTLAAAVCAAVPGAVCVPMDGFHLSTATLTDLGRVERRGAPDTFDAAGYVALIKQLRAGDEAVVRAPGYDRSIEEPVPGAIAVPRGAPLVLTEGNYLLLADQPWCRLRELLDEVWFVTVDEVVRIERLVARHVAYGRDLDVAHARVTRGSDATNARLVASTRRRADLVVDMTRCPDE